MGEFAKVRCPVCGWQISPQVFFRAWGEDDLREVGLRFFSGGRGKLEATQSLWTPGELEEALREDEKGVFRKVKDRFLDALEKWCVWGWLDRFEVLSRLKIFPLGGGIYVELFEKTGRRPKERVKYEYDFLSKQSKELARKPLKPVIGREVKTYEW